MDKLYKAVAEKHGVSEAEIKAEIDKAIAEAYKNSDALAKEFPDGKVPEADDVIALIMNKLNKSSLS